jgi:hypothetical protein
MSKKPKRTEPYTIFPRRLILDKELNKLSVHARWLFTVICTEWNSKAFKKPFKFTYRQLNNITGFDDRRISACIKELVKAEFIEVITNGGLYRNPNEYTINMFHMKLRDNPRIAQIVAPATRVLTMTNLEGPGNTN